VHFFKISPIRGENICVRPLEPSGRPRIHHSGRFQSPETCTFPGRTTFAALTEGVPAYRTASRRAVKSRVSLPASCTPPSMAYCLEPRGNICLWRVLLRWTGAGRRAGLTRRQQARGGAQPSPAIVWEWRLAAKLPPSTCGLFLPPLTPTLHASTCGRFALAVDRIMDKMKARNHTRFVYGLVGLPNPPGPDGYNTRSFC